MYNPLFTVVKGGFKLTRGAPVTPQGRTLAESNMLDRPFRGHGDPWLRRMTKLFCLYILGDRDINEVMVSI